MKARCSPGKGLLELDGFFKLIKMMIVSLYASGGACMRADSMKSNTSHPHGLPRRFLALARLLLEIAVSPAMCTSMSASHSTARENNLVRSGQQDALWPKMFYQ